jgi:hypothetical protein
MEEQRSYLGWVIGIAVLVAAAAIGYNAWRQSRPVEVPPPVAQSEMPAPPTAPAEPQIQHPLPANEAEPLPPLEKSDPLLAESLTQLLGGKSVAELFVTDGIVRRIVATIDNLPREKVSTRIMLARPVPGTLAVDKSGDDMLLAARNSTRYARYVQLAQSIDVKRAVALYVRLYPLFQRAYQDLGYPKGYFNDRLVEVIDHLMAAPEARAPLKLMQPKVRYEYVDPALESLSAGQKIMLRMGADNAAKVKAVLSDVRRELVEQAPKQ